MSILVFASPFAMSGRAAAMQRPAFTAPNFKTNKRTILAKRGLRLGGTPDVPNSISSRRHQPHDGGPFYRSDHSCSQEVCPFRPPSKSCANRYSLLDSGKYSDITITCNGETFEVHKAIVYTRYPFLKTFEPAGADNVSSACSGPTILTAKRASSCFTRRSVI